MLQIVPNIAMRIDTASRSQFKRVSGIDNFSLNSCKWQISGNMMEIVKLNKAPSKDYICVNNTGLYRMHVCIKETLP